MIDITKPIRTKSGIGNVDSNLDLENMPSPEPLTPADVPPGSCARHKGSNWWFMILRVDPFGFLAESQILGSPPELYNWTYAMNKLEIKRPGEDWKPFSR